MKGIEDTRRIERYIALDIHKEYVLAGGQNAKQEWLMLPRVKQIACARVKTDKKDTLILSRLLAANLVPVVWVPSLRHS